MAKRRRVVGAAGFEPATCSTQNCRATRLRYTPWHTWRLLDTCFAGCQQGGRLPPLSTSKSTRPRALFLEHSPGDLVARCDSKLARRAADYFQHRPDRPPGGNEAVREWFGILRDAQNAAIRPDEDHVERDVGVVHPEGD